MNIVILLNQASKRQRTCGTVCFASTVTDMPARLLLWFKNDLRVHDNRVVDQAVSLVKSGKADEVKYM